ncbi:MAG TPA: ATP-binding protein [Pyrinomonadaceae bacterium]|nr:ATP-binding protein [Pyrinomonadaceae bacterium]
MSEKEIELNLPSQIESIDKAVAEAVKFASESGFSDDALFAIDLALREAMANAVKHGNKFDENKDVNVTLRHLSGSLEIAVRDFGSGFAVEEVPDPTNPENLLKANGRGILFMRNFMDEVDWENPSGGGTIVKMVKKH